MKVSFIRQSIEDIETGESFNTDGGKMGSEMKVSFVKIHHTSVHTLGNGCLDAGGHFDPDQV